MIMQVGEQVQVVNLLPFINTAVVVAFAFGAGRVMTRLSQLEKKVDEFEEKQEKMHGDVLAAIQQRRNSDLQGG